jgi:hypothetical protein
MTDGGRQLLISGAAKHDKVQEKVRKAYFGYEPIPLDLALPLRKYKEWKDRNESM